MKLISFDFVQAAGVRRAVVPAGDIQGDIAFQNDINGILAGLDARNPPILALGWMRQPVSEQPADVRSAAAAETGLRVIKGGGIRARVAADVGPRLAISRRF